MIRRIRLGLIGDNIASSKSPLFHVLAGQQTGLDVTYDRLIPPELGQSFEQVFDGAQTQGYDGLNITYPYKERVTKHVTIPDPQVAAIGAVNTVVFSGGDATGFNTDYSGFLALYRAARVDRSPGVICLIGCGGVGKAIAFALQDLSASVIRCVDQDQSKAQGLADALAQAGSSTAIEVHTDAVIAAKGADGLVNCTPLGMVGIGGSPLPGASMSGANWAFDAVYTPEKTKFLSDATAAGLRPISGFELFFEQAIASWKIFTGTALDSGLLRRSLRSAGE